MHQRCRHSQPAGCTQTTKHANGGSLFILVNPDARKWRDQAKAHLLEGRDPSTIRKAEKQALVAKGQDAFEIVTREWRNTVSKVWSERYTEAGVLRL